MKNKKINSKSKKVSRIVKLLKKHFGEPKWKGRSNPLNCLIKTILSQSTNDRNRDMAYTALRQKYPDWETVKNTSSEEIAAKIRPAGLANQKSVRIKNILEWINQTYGSLNLEFINEMDPNEVAEIFMQLNGIGLKTISVVQMFSCGVDVFPVDTHVHRLCKRIGLVPEKTSAEKTHWLMQPLVPLRKSYSLHMNFLKLGRTICKARNPRCPDCPISGLCTFGQKTIKNGNIII